MVAGLKGNKNDVRAVERRMEREMFGTITQVTSGQAGCVAWLVTAQLTAVSC